MTYSAGAAAGDTAYYTGGGGGGREKYYMEKGSGNPDGVWYGKLAEELGLVGPVKPEDMKHVFDTLTGLNGEKLGQGPSANGVYRPVEEQVAAWMEAHPRALEHEVAAARVEIEAKARNPQNGIDVTYSLPKSQTLLVVAAERAAQEAERRGDTRTAERMQEHAKWLEGVFMDANEAALRWAESSGALTTHVGWYTGGRDGAERYSQVEGLVVARFLQRESQAGDPQEHIHNVILSRARAEDGDIRRPDGFVLKGAGGAKWGMSAVAGRVVAERLHRAGIPMVMREDGVEAECSLVGQDMIDLYSKRSRGQIKPRVAQMIEEYKQRNGVEPGEHLVSAMTRLATQVTRGRKVAEGKTRGELLDRWQAEARKVTGRGLLAVAEGLDKAVTGKHRVKAAKWSPEGVKAEALARVSGAHATWTEHRLMSAVQECLPVGAFAEVPDEKLEEAITSTVSRLAREILESEEAVQVGGLGIEAKEIEEREQYGSPTHVVFAAKGTLAAEDKIRQTTIERGGQRLTRGAIEGWIKHNAKSIGEDQRAVLIGLATTDARMAVLEAPAGTGKSYTVGKLAAAWEDLTKSGRVHGIAVGSRQAEVLAEEGLGTTANTTVWLNAQARIAAGKALQNDHHLRLLAGDVVVLDEASQVDTDQLKQILDVTRAAGARLVLVQDPRQMQSVGAGGAPGLLENHAETYRLAEVRRFIEDWEKDASLRIRECDTDILAEYDRHGRLLDAESVEAAHASAARAVFVDLAEGKTSMAVAGSNAEAGRVANLVREHLLAAGKVERHGVELGEEVGGGHASRGDLVQLRSNDRKLDVLNRQTWKVEGVRAGGGLRVVNPTTGELRDLPAEYVAEHVALAYAGTVNAVQGVTLDREHGVFTGGLSTAEAVYVAMSRGREANTAHVYCPVNQATGDRPSARAVLGESVASDGRQVAATVAKERDELRRQSARFVIGRQEDVTFAACRDRLARHLDELAAEGVLSAADRARLGADKSVDHLSRRLRGMELAGHDPREVLRESLEGGKLPPVGSVAQLLAWRVGEAHGTPEPVRSGMPADIDPVYEARLENIRGMVDDRTSTLGRETAEAAPAWAVTHLGPVPEAGTEARQAWEEKAAKVAVHREASEWSDPDRALPGAPSVYNTERRSSWLGAFEAIGRPEEERPEATMTPGQLRVRVKAWDRILDLAPKYADEDMKSAHYAAEQARQKAAFEKDEVAKKEAKGLSGMWSSIAKVLGRQAEVRDAFLDEHRTTRDYADRAAAEIERRELPAVGEEADLTTYEEWMGIEAVAKVEDDEHRVITEMNLAEEETRPVASWADQDVEAETLAAAPAKDWRSQFLPSYRPPATDKGLTEEEAAGLDMYAEQTWDRIADWQSQDAAEPEHYDAGEEMVAEL